MEYITNEERNAAVTTKNAKIQSLYTSEESGRILRKVFESHSLPPAQYPIYATTIGDAILGFFPFTELADKLAKHLEVGSDKAQSILKDLENFLSPVAETASELNKAVDANEVAEPEVISVEPLRTMERDMKKAHGYGATAAPEETEEVVHKSNQDESLKRPPLGTTSSYTERPDKE